MNSKRNRLSGRFSLIEIMICIAMVALLCGLLLPKAMAADPSSPHYIEIGPGAYPAAQGDLARLQPIESPAYNPNLTVGQNVQAQMAAVAELAIAGQVNAPPAPTNAPPTPGTFLGSVLGYFSNTSDLQTFQTNDTLDIWTGAEYVNNLNTAATLGFSYNIWKQAQADPFGFGLESQTRNAGVAGTILSQGIGINVQKVYRDIKLEAFAEGEKNFVLNTFDAEVGVRIFKALTDNTFGGFGVSEFIGGGGTSKVPNFLVFLGAKM